MAAAVFVNSSSSAGPGIECRARGCCLISLRQKAGLIPPSCFQLGTCGQRGLRLRGILEFWNWGVNFSQYGSHFSSISQGAHVLEIYYVRVMLMDQSTGNWKLSVWNWKQRSEYSWLSKVSYRSCMAGNYKTYLLKWWLRRDSVCVWKYQLIPVCPFLCKHIKKSPEVGGHR